jgi:hypothetical protein
MEERDPARMQCIASQTVSNRNAIYKERVNTWEDHIRREHSHPSLVEDLKGCVEGPAAERHHVSMATLYGQLLQVSDPSCRVDSVAQLLPLSVGKSLDNGLKNFAMSKKNGSFGDEAATLTLKVQLPSVHRPLQVFTPVFGDASILTPLPLQDDPHLLPVPDICSSFSRHVEVRSRPDKQSCLPQASKRSVPRLA